MTVNLNFNLAIRQATQIENIASGMRSLANDKMTNAIATIDASWDGETSNLFLRHCEETKKQITLRAAELDNLAQRIKEVARIMREAEGHASR